MGILLVPGRCVLIEDEARVYFLSDNLILFGVPRILVSN